jgi:hypothetical protein
VRRKLLQALLAGATLLVVWLVVSPAAAASSRAPVCDPRGAIGFAPPPQIQDPELSLDIPADCVEVSPLESKNVIPGHRLIIDVSSSQEPTTPGRQALPSPTRCERLAIDLTTCGRPPSGVRASIDRPPRI